MKKLNYLDLFSGAGGLSEGFFDSGFSPVAHIEMDRAACYTLETRLAFHWLQKKKRTDLYDSYLEGRISRENFYSQIPNRKRESIINCEITQDNVDELIHQIRNLGKNKIDVIIGGPPCQAYSLTGRARDIKGMKGDKRNYLYVLYAKFLDAFQPEVFVFENVTGLLSARDLDGSLHFEKMKKLFAECGYGVSYRVLNATDYGVLQNRKRIILVGRKGVPQDSYYPDIKRSPNELMKKFHVNDVFCDLPFLRAGEGTPDPVETLDYNGEYLYYSGIKEHNHQKVTFHCSRPNTEQDLEIYKMAIQMEKKGKRMSYLDLPNYLQSQHNKTAFLDRFKVVRGDENYSQTIVAHIAKDGHYYIHPSIDQNRSLTPREAARLQTFPDDYFFESFSGKKSRTAAFHQIGNAVPVLLAKKIAQAICADLN